MLDHILTALEWLARAFTEYKILFERSLSFSDDVIHVLVGLVIQITAASLLRTNLKDWRPLATVLIIELGNEALDIAHDLWPVPAMQLGESIKDVVLTMCVPIVLMMLLRLSPRLFIGTEADDLRNDLGHEETKSG